MPSRKLVPVKRKVTTDTWNWSVQPVGYQVQAEGNREVRTKSFQAKIFLLARKIRYPLYFY
jgi:hypothetical protein